MSEPNDPAPTCQRCRFWDGFDDRKGECRRRSPQSFMGAMVPRNDDDSMFEMTYWPTTYNHDWCGEFEGDQ